jgi:hypothetical protein
MYQKTTHMSEERQEERHKKQMAHGMGVSREVEVDSSLAVDIVLDLAAGNLTPCDNQQESWDHNVEAEHMHSFVPVLARSSFRLEHHRVVDVAQLDAVLLRHNLFFLRLASKPPSASESPAGLCEHGLPKSPLLGPFAHRTWHSHRSFQ